MKRKRLLSVVLSLFIAAGAVGFGTPMITQPITTQAAVSQASCYSFNETTGELTLRGKVDRNAICGFSYKNDVKSIIAEDGTRLPENSSQLFSNFINCTSIDLSKAETRNVTKMNSMFENCYDLKTLDINGFVTGKVDDMSYMFCCCYKLESLDVSGFTTSDVTKMDFMFYGCNNIESLDLSRFDTAKVTDMFAMFAGCENIESLDVSSFDTSIVSNMSCMFDCCYKLKSLNLSGLVTSDVTDMSSMFAGCYSLEALDLSGFDTSKVTDMSRMFACCYSLEALDLSEFDTSIVTDMSNMFLNCDDLGTLTLGENFKELKKEACLPNTGYWVYDNNPTAGASGLDMYAVIKNEGNNTYRRFLKCYTFYSRTGALNLRGEIDRNAISNLSFKDDVKSIIAQDGTVFPENCEDLFYGFKNCTSIDLSKVDTTKVEVMSGMFARCYKLENLDLSNFHTFNVTDMDGMFSDCNNLKSLDLSRFETGSVTNMSNMFRGCNNLETLTLGKDFNRIKNDARLSNSSGWVKESNSSTIVSGDGTYADIQNNGKNTYKLYTGDLLTYPTNIKVEYNEKNHQVKFTWDKVRGADRYGIAVYQSGKWRIQTQDITDTVYTSPKNLTPGKTYKVAIAARVNGEWDTENAIKNAVTVTIK